MILKDDGDIESDSSQEDSSKNDGYSSDETSCKGDLFMTSIKVVFAYYPPLETLYTSMVELKRRNAH
ncbi:hypothetical protein CR513_35243, partial [Mucuna pruriens]